MVNSKLRRHKVMEKAIKKLMAANLPPRFKFEDTYNSIVVPVEYQQHLPTQSQLEAEFDALIIEEDAMPTTTTDIENLDIISANVYSNTATGRVGIGTASPAGTLHVHSTDSIVLPGGTTAQRNSTPVNGMLRYNTETEYMEVYTDGGWGSLASPPTITSFSPSAVSPAASNGTVLTINGSLFDQNASVELRNESGNLYSTSNVAFTNSGLITATLGSLAVGTYTVIATNGSGLSVDSTSTFSVNNPPVWSSPADGATLTFLTNSSTTTTLSATDPDGSAITYSLVSGTLPSGLTLSGNTISGTSGAAGGTSTQVTIRASDGTVFTDRSFTIETVSPLYAFTSHTFTPATATGRIGPTLTQLRTAYSGASWSTDTNFLNVTTYGIQEWTVPVDGTYQIEAVGAAGAHQSNGPGQGGKGARMIGSFTLSKNTIVKIAVGQRGRGGPGAGTYPGGGGGTFVWVNDPPNDPLIIAGGGAGINSSSGTPANADGQSGTSAGIASYSPTSIEGQIVGVGHGSWLGNGRYSCSGGGAGWLSEGNDSSGNGSASKGIVGSYWKQSNATCGSYGCFGRDIRLQNSLLNYNSVVVSSSEKLYGGFGSCAGGNEANSTGGFGGGGGGGCGGEGGGGGYTGGGATYGNNNYGGGAGSYNGGTNQSNTSAYRTGDGYCVITKI
jgi:hypothetical protein